MEILISEHTKQLIVPIRIHQGMQLTVLPLKSFTSNSLIHLFIFRENILIASLINKDIALKTLHCILNNDASSVVFGNFPSENSFSFLRILLIKLESTKEKKNGVSMLYEKLEGQFFST